MARPVVWSDPAVEDLEAAVEFIAKDSDAYARSLAQLAVDAAESLRASRTVVTACLIPSCRGIASSSLAPIASCTWLRRSASSSLQSFMGTALFGER